MERTHIWLSGFVVAWLVAPALSAGEPASCLHWNEISAGGPVVRNSHALVYDAAQQRTLLFGGIRNNLELNDFDNLSDTWEFDGSGGGGGGTWQQRAVVGPSRRYDHAMAYDSARGVVVLFGGVFREVTKIGENFTYYAQTWEWDGDGGGGGGSWSIRQALGPSPRAGHAMAYDETRSVVVMFGGFNASLGSNSNETWEWDGKAWVLRGGGGVAGPPPRVGASLVYDAAREVCVLFGGEDGGNLLGDTWEYDGLVWTQRKGGAGPAPRAHHAMVYDSYRKLTVLHGGATSNDPLNLSDETWQWSGTAWQLVQPSGPGPRQLHAMAYDSDRLAAVLFSGDAPNALVNTWELTFNTACNGDTNSDDTVNVDDLLAVISQWGDCLPGCCAGDITRNRSVNVDDLLEVIGSWGPCP